ncbi:MAG: ABC transporter permease [Gammaproteobacteria bacterium]
MSVLWQGLAAIVVRPRHALLALAGFFIATTVLIALLAIPHALSRAAAVTGSNDVVLLLARTSNFAMGATLPANDADIAANLAGVVAAAPELIVTKRLRRTDGTETNVLIRGVTGAAFGMTHPALKLVSGRRFKPGTNEAIVGRAAARTFPQLVQGGQVSLANSLWRVSGHFAAGDSLWESEIWVPLTTLQSAVNAQGKISTVLVKLASPNDFARFKKAVQADPRLDVRLERQREYYSRQVGFLAHFARLGVWGVAILLGLAALAAIANAVGLGLVARGGELAVLRTLGFTRSSLAIALIVEVLITGLVGAGLAALLCWQLLKGFNLVTGGTGHAIALHLSVDPALIGTAIAYALVLGLVSALGPCLYAVARPLARGLREE